MAGVDAVEELAGLVGGEHGRLAAFDDVLRAAYRAGRVEGHDAAAGQPVEQHADGGQVLLDGGGGDLRSLAELLDVGGDVHRLDVGQGQAVPLAPGEEIAGGTGVGSPGVAVADGGGEELDEAFGGLVAGVGDDGGQDEAASVAGDARAARL